MEPKKIKYNKLNLPDYKNTTDSLIRIFKDKISLGMDNLFERALANKGFVFDNKQDLIKFVSENCYKEIDHFRDQIVYKIKNVGPFLIYEHEKEYLITKIINNRDISFSIDLNKFYKIV